MMASSVSSGFLRSENGSRVMNIEPKFEPLAPCTKEKPATVSVCATPLVLRVMSSIFAKAALVRCSDAASGSCTLTMIRPWSCCGTNPRGLLTSFTSASKELLRSSNDLSMMNIVPKFGPVALCGML